MRLDSRARLPFLLLGGGGCPAFRSRPVLYQPSGGVPVAVGIHYTPPVDHRLVCVRIPVLQGCIIV